MFSIEISLPENESDSIFVEYGSIVISCNDVNALCPMFLTVLVF